MDADARARPYGAGDSDNLWRQKLKCEADYYRTFRAPSDTACAEACFNDPNCNFATNERKKGAGECRLHASCSESQIVKNKGYRVWTKPGR